MTDRPIEILAPRVLMNVFRLQLLQVRMRYMRAVPDSEPEHTPIILQKKS